MRWCCQGCSCASKMYCWMIHIAAQNSVVGQKLSIFHTVARKNEYKTVSVMNASFLCPMAAHPLTSHFLFSSFFILFHSFTEGFVLLTS